MPPGSRFPDPGGSQNHDFAIIATSEDCQNPNLREIEEKPLLKPFFDLRRMPKLAILTKARPPDGHPTCAPAERLQVRLLTG